MYIATRKYSSMGMAMETVSRKRRWREEETNGGNEFPNRRKKSRQENNMQPRTHRSSRRAAIKFREPNFTAEKFDMYSCRELFLSQVE